MRIKQFLQVLLFDMVSPNKIFLRDAPDAIF